MGKIDRIDLCFDEENRLDHIQVLDYKGASREESKTEAYAQRVMDALDCQLPLYAFAAQQYFFGRYDLAETNARTKAGYLIQSRDIASFKSKRKKALLAMDWPDLTARFRSSLQAQIDCMRKGDFQIPIMLVFEIINLLRTHPFSG